MATILLFASAREAAGCRADQIVGDTVGDVLDAAVARYGSDFEAVLTTCAIWCNGEPAQRQQRLIDSDEVAVLPPVSGGSQSY